MNTEQVEGQLREFKDKHICIGLPIRGTIHMSFYGKLSIMENWNDDNSIILYSVATQAVDICFRAQDVMEIKYPPTQNIAAAIMLNIEENAGQKYANHEK